jgi:hypothetical protein
MKLIDVRNPGEVAHARVEGATIVPLIKISQALLAGKLQERFPPQGG